MKASAGKRSVSTKDAARTATRTTTRDARIEAPVKAPLKAATKRAAAPAKAAGGAAHSAGKAAPTRAAAPAKAVATAPRSATARERIDDTAYELFSRRGVRAVGVDEVVARSGVAKMTLYRHYPSKDQLALSFLRRREELWTRAWLQAEVERRTPAPAERLLAIFEVFDKWFRKADFEGCTFINVLLENDRKDHPVRLATVAHLATIRVFLRGLAEAAGVSEPEGFARQWHILMKGSIVAAGEGDREAALRAREIGRLLLANEGIAVGARPSRAAKALSAPRAARAARARGQ